MEPLILAQQSLLVGSRLEGLFNSAPEGESPRQIRRDAFYGVTDALLNITEGPDGQLLVDVSMQANSLETVKTSMGLRVLNTLDWLRQVSGNIREANKPALVAQSMIGLPSAMGVMNLLKTDFYENPLHALVVDMPEQQDGMCREALSEAQLLCGSGIEAGRVGYCSDGQRFQVNFFDGNVSYVELSEAGALAFVPVSYGCEQIGVTVQPAQMATEEVPQAPSVEATVPPVGGQGQPIPDYDATPGVPDVKCIENPLIGTFDTAAVIAGFKAACGIDINDAMAQEFLDYTQTEGRTDLYGLATAEQLAMWAEQQWPRFMMGQGDEETPVALPSTTIEEVTPITSTPESVTPGNDCVEPVRIEIPIELIGDEGLAFLRNEVLLQCGVELTDLEAEAIMQSRNESLPENVHVVSENYLKEIKSHKIDIEDYSPGERYSSLGRFLAVVSGLSFVGTTLYMVLKRYRMSDIFPANIEE